jgi:DNA-directed RNA polymerase specialized sigma24 family protein
MPKSSNQCASVFRHGCALALSTKSNEAPGHMPMPEQKLSSMQAGPGDFCSTHWSVVLRAGQSDSRLAEAALEDLCQGYWYPIYSFVRRRGYSPEDAQDLTQEFFSHLLADRGLATVHPAKGRFRSFLLASLKNLLANEWNRARTQKRGSGVPLFSLDEKSAEDHFQLEPPDNTTPETLFERRWAETLLERVLLRVRAEWNERDKQQRFDSLKAFLTDRRGEVPFAEMAAKLGTTVPALRSVVHKLREVYRRVFLDEIAQTVEGPGEIEDEVRRLFAALGE